MKNNFDTDNVHDVGNGKLNTGAIALGVLIALGIYESIRLGSAVVLSKVNKQSHSDEHISKEEECDVIVENEDMDS